MPKVEFVNEHRAVEVDEGRFISDIADELGIAVCREEFAGTGIGDYTVWVQGGPLSPWQGTGLEDARVHGQNPVRTMLVC